MSLVEKILERLDIAAEGVADLLELIAAGKTGYWKVRNAQYRGRRPSSSSLVELYRRRQRFYTLLSHLKKDGLIESKGKKGEGQRGSIWGLTKKGFAHLVRIRDRQKDPLSLEHARYEPVQKPALLLFIYDVPEREERKRRWLREVLKRLGFVMVQRSVWLGRQVLPKEFLRDLHRHDLIHYVHVLSISKRGTIRRIA